MGPLFYGHLPPKLRTPKKKKISPHRNVFKHYISNKKKYFFPILNPKGKIPNFFFEPFPYRKEQIQPGKSTEICIENNPNANANVFLMLDMQSLEERRNSLCLEFVKECPKVDKFRKMFPNKTKYFRL